MPTSVKHHYVPEWYQKGFLAEGQTQLWVLDKSPQRYPLPKGGYSVAKDVYQKGPAAWFFEKHLYTVQAFGQANDDIERYLFGEIDTKGAAATGAFLASDWDKIHHLHSNVFEFMDALRLRTPKGLRWLKEMGKTKTQMQLMYLMQELRRMHCVMWVEGIWEIVSAKNSKHKFIFSDHPVTFFNPHVFPVSASGQPAPDPELEWIGTQTLFPFDKDNLFVLTHLEGEKGVGSAAARKPRTNARYFDTSIVKYDKCIRDRELSDEQVLEVNYIIKQRADKYVAGGTREELYPEKHLKSRMWPKLGRFLLPPSSKTFNSGGDIVIGMNDGSFMFQDAFGRRPTSKKEHDAKVAEAEALQKHAFKLLAEHHAKKGTGSTS